MIYKFEDIVVFSELFIIHPSQSLEDSYNQEITN